MNTFRHSRKSRRNATSRKRWLPTLFPSILSAMIHTLYLTFHKIRKLKLSVFRDFQPRVHERERKKMLKTVIFLLETRYRKILAKLLRVSSEKQRKQAKGKNMIKKKLYKEKKTPTARFEHLLCEESAPRGYAVAEWLAR